MDNKESEVYGVIAEAIYDVVPDDFNIAYFHMEVTDDVWGGELFYNLKGERGYKYVNEGLEEVVKRTKNTRQHLRKSGYDPFTVATVALNSDGKFSVDLGYEDISDFGKAPERREEWIKKNIGNESKIDWF